MTQHEGGFEIAKPDHIEVHFEGESMVVPFRLVYIIAELHPRLAAALAIQDVAEVWAILEPYVTGGKPIPI